MAKARASTQEHLEISDIADNLVILKNGSVSLILQTTAVNFGLLSESEQDVIIYAYAALLNSLNFPIQIIIRSKRSDVSFYLNLLQNHEDKQTNPDLKKQIKQYREFVAATVQKNQVLDKSFYVVVTMTALELGVRGAAATLAKKQKGLPYPKEYLIEKAKTNLYPKRDHLIKQFTRIGLRARELETQELVELYYDVYNPTEVSSQKVSAEGTYYTAPLIAPAIDQPASPQVTSSQKDAAPTPKINLQSQTQNQPLISHETPVKRKEEQVISIQPASQKVIGQEPVATGPPPPSQGIIIGNTPSTTNPNQIGLGEPAEAKTQREALKDLQEAIVKANQMLGKQKGQQDQKPIEDQSKLK